MMNYNSDDMINYVNKDLTWCGIFDNFEVSIVPVWTGTMKSKERQMFQGKYEQAGQDP